MTTISEALNMRSGINVQGKVDRKEEVRTVNTKAGGTVDVANAFLVDDSGEIKLTLWADDAKNIKDGDEIKIENGYTNEFKGEVQLTKGKYGKLEVIQG
ncbi:MAG: DNA-binding protein [Candidatus Nitrosopelagicus sp.]|jgi:replication factor A1|nr:DNA-binding protein [Candidatus Nitrosopelagicus sp.]